jgi:hypothetical protein
MTMTTVFISYARVDVDSARQLYQALVDAVHEAWMDETKLLPGQRWEAALGEAIKNCRYFLAIFSSRSVNRSGFVHRELAEALKILDSYPESEIYLIPVRLDNCNPSHAKLNELHWVDMFPDWQAGIARILTALASRTPDRSETLTDEGLPTAKSSRKKAKHRQVATDRVMPNDGGNPKAASTAPLMTNEAKAAWFFGVLFTVFLLGVFIFGPASLPQFKQQILGFICASLAGFFAGFFTGTLLLNTELPLSGKWIISGGAGFALFLIVLFWWRSPSAPIAAVPDTDSARGRILAQSSPSSSTKTGSSSTGHEQNKGGESTSTDGPLTNNSSTEHSPPSSPTRHKQINPPILRNGNSSPHLPASQSKQKPAVPVLPALDIPPIVNWGAPIGTKYQNRYLKNNIECIGETVKVDATEWQERNSSDSPASCNVDAVIFKYTERESNDPQFFLLYDEGRNLFARIPNIPVGQTGPTDWRLVSSPTWNVGRSLTRIN